MKSYNIPASTDTANMLSKPDHEDYQVLGLYFLKISMAKLLLSMSIFGSSYLSLGCSYTGDVNLEQPGFATA